MRFEITIGWRYLYGGKRDRTMLAIAGASGLVALIGLALIGLGVGQVGALVVVVGLLALAVSGLLAMFSVFTSVSVLGVALGVAALTIVLSVTTGFQKQFQDKVLGVKAHVTVSNPGAPVAVHREAIAATKASDPDVLAVQPFVIAEMLVTRGKGEISGVLIKGIDPALVTGVLDLREHIIEGSVESLGERCASEDATCTTLPPIILGKQLAAKVKAKLGDVVTVVSPLSDIDFETFKPRSSAPRTKRFRVTGIFYSGFDEFDRRLMYAAIDDIPDIGAVVAGLEVKVKDPDRAAAIAQRLQVELGEPWVVQDWREMNQGLFDALKLQKLVLVIILTLIIIVAAVNMVSALTMMVTDKTREIAILKSMGSTSGSMAQVFQIVGLAIGGIGTLVGVGLGLALCHLVGSYGFPLDPRIYLIDRLPIEVRGLEVLLVAGITMVISILATIAPAVSASALRPVEGLRYD